MKKIKIPLILLVIIAVCPKNLLASPVRIYCKSDGVIFERRADQVPFTNDNRTYKDVSSFVIDESQIPPYKYAEQLKCQNNRLVLDSSIKTPRIFYKEAVERVAKEYDTELDKDEPDVVKLLRLQRDRERIKNKDQETISKYQN